VLADLDVATVEIGEFYARIALGKDCLALVHDIARVQFAGTPVRTQRMGDAAQGNYSGYDGAGGH